MVVNINGLMAQRDKWKRRARLFLEAYKDKDFEAFNLNLQKLQLEAYGADKVLPMQNEHLRASLLKTSVERNKLRTVLTAMAARFDGVDNGYCRLCHTHRLCDLKGTPQPCRNEACLSKQVAEALKKPERDAEIAQG